MTNSITFPLLNEKPFSFDSISSTTNHCSAKLLKVTSEGEMSYQYQLVYLLY